MYEVRGQGEEHVLCAHLGPMPGTAGVRRQPQKSLGCLAGEAVRLNTGALEPEHAKTTVAPFFLASLDRQVVLTLLSPLQG